MRGVGWKTRDVLGLLVFGIVLIVILVICIHVSILVVDSVYGWHVPVSFTSNLYGWYCDWRLPGMSLSSDFSSRCFWSRRMDLAEFWLRSSWAAGPSCIWIRRLRGLRSSSENLVRFRPSNPLKYLPGRSCASYVNDIDSQEPLDAIDYLA